VSPQTHFSSMKERGSARAPVLSHAEGMRSGGPRKIIVVVYWVCMAGFGGSLQPGQRIRSPHPDGNPAKRQKSGVGRPA